MGINFTWSVKARGKTRLIAPNSRNSFAVRCDTGKVVVVEGDMARPGTGDGRTDLIAGQTQVFTPGANDLYVEGSADANGTCSSV